MQPERQNPFTFIVRLWREKSDDESIWRGSVERVQSGERAYFQGMAKIKDAIVRMLGDSSREEDDNSET
ncbi:MAG: hypothetical protein HFACDABA_01759 [Anaerolineales bacterium]|nr:hypothetical protein [Anaerolineales bacterium]